MATQAPEHPDSAALAPVPHSMAQTLARLHPWIDFVPQQQRRLGLFICLAVAVHLAAFFFVRIDSTRAELQHPPRIHVTVENAHPAVGAESDSFLDRLADPRLFLFPAEPLNRFAANESAPDLAEINSHLGTQQFPAPAPAVDYSLMPADSPSLSAQVDADMHPARQAFTYDEKGPLPPAKTTWQWDPDLAARKPASVPDLPSPVTDTDLSPTELRVAIDPEGAVQHVLLEQSCQQPELDQQAVLATRKLRFPAVRQPGLAWTRVTVFWHCTAPPVDVVVPTPLTPSGP